MTDLIALARQVDAYITPLHGKNSCIIEFNPLQLQAFAELIRHDEREALIQFFDLHWHDQWTDSDIIKAIRARTT